MASKWWDKTTVNPRREPDEIFAESNRAIITKDGKHIRLDNRDIYYLNLIDSLTESDIADIYR